MKKEKLFKLASPFLALALVLSFVLVAAPQTVSAQATLHVPGDHATIQAAIDAASSGDTIIVHDGTYAENVVVDESLTVQAAVGENPVIDGGGMMGPGVHITAADVTFQDFTVRNFTCDPYAPPEYPSGAGMGAIWVVGDGAVIDGNTIYNIRSTASPGDLTDPDMWPAGIGIDVAANDVDVTNNLVHDVDSIGIRVRSDYEEAWPGDTEMSGILVEDNIVCNTANSGVLVAGVVTGVTIRGNVIYDSLAPTPYGLLVVAGASAVGVPNNVLIEGNTIYGSYGNLCLGSVTDITVTGNTISGAIPHYSDPDNIKGKNIYIRDWTGVETSNVNITNNNITGADGYGVNIKGAAVDVSTITINNNNISGNTDYGVLNEIATVVDATNNWWGNVSGPYHATNSSGTGDEVSDYVDYDPWLPCLASVDDTTTLRGDPPATIEISAPSDRSGWVLMPGITNTISGTLNVKCNTSWQVKASDEDADTGGHMTKWTGSAYDTSAKLGNAMEVWAATGVTLPTGGTIDAGPEATGDIGKNITVVFKQTVSYADAVVSPHHYCIVVTFTGTTPV